MHDVFTQLSIVILITTGVSLIMRVLRQPLILGYILSGLLVGPSLLNTIHSAETFEAYSKLGIVLLLFIIGLGMHVSELRKLGKVVIVTATASLVTVGSLGATASLLLGFNRTEALIIGLALFFSSTIIIVKILTDKKEQNRLHGQIAIGVILADDIVATFALLFVAANKSGGVDAHDLLLLVVKGVVLIGLLALCSTKLLPKFSRYIASSQEMLFLFAMAWGFGIASLFEAAGFSVEVGALFSGVALASSPYAQEIAARLKPLRDFFVVIFFITLGESLNLSNLSHAVWPAVILSLIVIVGKPFVITTTMGMLGYAKRVSFKTGINLSQISEFSIVLVVLAASVGLVRPEISAVLTLVAIATIATSTYLMHYDNQLYALFDKIKIRAFEKEVVYKEKRTKQGYPLLLFGYHHGGHEFVKTFQEIGKRYMVIDYDPTVIESLEHQNIPYMYGDATDNELLEEVGISNTKLVIITFSDFAMTSQLVSTIHRINPQTVIICHAENQTEAVSLYDLGSTYVMIPHFIGSEKISAFIRRSGLDKAEFSKYRDKHLSQLHRRLGVTALS